MSRAVLCDNERNVEVTIPVSADVQRAIQAATVEAFEQVGQGVLDEALKPFGLTGMDIAIPTYEQVIYEDEVPIFSAITKGQA